MSLGKPWIIKTISLQEKKKKHSISNKVHEINMMTHNPVICILYSTYIIYLI